MDVTASTVPAALLPFQDEVQAWLAEHMRDGLGFAWSATWTTRDNEPEYAFRRRLGRELGEIGWLFPTYPLEYGGGGLTADHQAIIEAELGRYGLRLSMVYYTLARIVAPCILQFGTDEQRRAFLPGLVRGEVVVWQLLTEPQSGSDIANCQTRSTSTGDAYVTNGQKVMVGSHHRPDFLWTLVCTDPEGKRHENLSWLYIPADLPGITIQPMSMMMGIKNAVFFDDVQVPAGNLVGGENDGWTVSSTHLELEHGGAGSITGDPTIDRLVEFCQTTMVDGAPLIEDPAIRSTLADALIETHVCNLLASRNYWARLRRDPHPYGGAQFRYLERLLRLHNARRLQQIVGYEALIPDLEVREDEDFEHLARAGPGQLHGGGTLDTDRLIIARRMGIGRPARERAPTTF
jgi:alkylation response protein AidB-like acyl-CoA dehydrogenase